MKAFTHKLGEVRDIEPHDHHIFEEQENEKDDIISRMEEMQQRFGQLQLQDRKPSYWDRIMSDPNRKDRYDDALLEAHMEAQREYYGDNSEDE